MSIVSTIIPIFIIIFLGWFARQKGFISPEFVTQANRLVYYIAIPAMIFTAISKSSLKTEINPTVIFVILGALLLVSVTAWGFTRVWKLPRPTAGSFIQCSFHGNIGYIAFAVAFYYLGDRGFVKIAIIAGFVMILQNFLSVVILQYHGMDPEGRSLVGDTFKKTIANPVILSALTGIIFSFFNIPIPLVLDRALDILKGMALPLALLIIGASLSFEKIRPHFFPVLITTFLKLILIPLIGLAAFKVLSVPGPEYLPGLIILSSPTATLAYILAKEIGGDPDFAAAAISVSTIFSSLTYGFWLSMG